MTIWFPHIILIISELLSMGILTQFPADFIDQLDVMYVIILKIRKL
jgi:hypothetical protein